MAYDWTGNTLQSADAFTVPESQSFEVLTTDTSINSGGEFSIVTEWSTTLAEKIAGQNELKLIFGSKNVVDELITDPILTDNEVVPVVSDADYTTSDGYTPYLEILSHDASFGAVF